MAQGAVPSAAAALIGVAVCLWGPQLPPRAACLLLLVCGLLAACLLQWRGASAWRPWLPACALALAAWGDAGWQTWTALNHQLPAQWEGRELLVRGQVVDLPEIQPHHSRFQLRVDTASDLQTVLHGGLLRLSWYDDFDRRRVGQRLALQAGAHWQLRVKLRAPHGLRNPGGLDSERQALAERIVATGSVRLPDTAVELQPPHGIDAWRDQMSLRIAAAVSTPAAGYVRALALGDTRGLDSTAWEALRAAGLTHLIAISGFHVGLVGLACAVLISSAWRLFPALGYRMPRPHATAIAALLGAAAYAPLAGLSLPTIRTVLMIAVATAARLARCRVSAAQILALTLLAVLIWDPLSVLLAGFWLSFAGVAWLVWCLPADGQALFPGFVAAQAVTTVGLLPMSITLFGQACVIGPVANLVAIPWWTLVVVPLCLSGTALEALYPDLGSWSWRLAAWCFDLLWPGLVWLGHLPLATWWVPESGIAALLLALCGAFWLLLPRTTPGKALALLLWLPLLWPQRTLLRPGEVELLVLDVGQGLSVLVRTRQHALLFGTGPAVPDGFDASTHVVLPALHALGVRQLNEIVYSHADDAKYAGSDNAVQRGIATMIATAPEGVQPNTTRRCHAGQQWQWDGVRLRFLYLPPGQPSAGNRSSCVLRVEGKYGAALLTGDIDGKVERSLLQYDRDALRAKVVVVPHHGSGDAAVPPFIQAVDAQIALVSAGHANRFGYPRAEVVARWRAAGANVLNTADSGALQVRLGVQGIQLREQRRWQPRVWDAAKRL